MKPKRILILYTELAGYVLSCFRALKATTGAEIAVVHFPVNPEAPFQFSFPENISFHQRDQFKSKEELHQFAEKFSPDLIFCTGWIDKDYLAVCRRFKNKIPVVVGFDNWWRGDFRQQVAALVSPFTIRRSFTHAWIPGKPQEKFAHRLGFRGDKLLRGYYAADVDVFAREYEKYSRKKSASFPRRFVYAGRYYDFKGVTDLWEAFRRFRETNQDWELWCFGTGDITPPQLDGVKHFGFVQPDEMKNYLGETGVFVLPSRKEPWGVVVHEFAAAGFPLLCSTSVGAATQFLDEGKNGFSFPSSDVEALQSAFSKIAALSDTQLSAMSLHSHRLALSVTPETWATTLISVLH